jgi:hypothetical protein
MSKPANRTREPREFIHVELPLSTKELLRRLRYETRVSFTDILVRVLERANREAVINDWIRAGETPPGEEAATSA